MTNAEELLAALKEEGLFLAPLNNGDWMCGRASYVYGLRIGDDHYSDPYLCVGADLFFVICGAVKKFGKDRLSHAGS